MVERINHFQIRSTEMTRFKNYSKPSSYQEKLTFKKYHQYIYAKWHGYIEISKQTIEHDWKIEGHWVSSRITEASRSLKLSSLPDIYEPMVIDIKSSDTKILFEFIMNMNSSKNIKVEKSPIAIISTNMDSLIISLLKGQQPPIVINFHFVFHPTAL